MLKIPDQTFNVWNFQNQILTLEFSKSNFDLEIFKIKFWPYDKPR